MRCSERDREEGEMMAVRPRTGTSTLTCNCANPCAQQQAVNDSRSAWGGTRTARRRLRAAEAWRRAATSPRRPPTSAAVAGVEAKAAEARAEWEAASRGSSATAPSGSTSASTRIALAVAWRSTRRLRLRARPLVEGTPRIVRAPADLRGRLSQQFAAAAAPCGRRRRRPSPTTLHVAGSRHPAPGAGSPPPRRS